MLVNEGFNVLNKRNKYLLKNTLIFTIGNLGSKLISFVLIPLYTNILSTSQYGVVDLVMTLSMVAIPILTLNIYESVMRFALDKGRKKDEITQIGMLVFFVSCIVGLIIIPICNLFHQLSNYSILIYFYIITSAASQIVLCDLRGKELLLHYSIGNILNTFFIALFNIIFLSIFKLGINGFLLAYVIANFITTLYGLMMGKGYKALKIKKINKLLMVKMIKYSIVLIPNSFMWWIMNSSDRIMVTSMVGVSANGIYAISYKLPSLVSTITTIFNQAWNYSAIKELNSHDEEKYNNFIFKRYIAIVMLIGLLLLTTLKPFLSIYVGNEYYSAWKYSPFLIIGCVYLTLGTFMATSYSVHKDGFGFLFSAVFGAIFNIIGNYLLIPNFGIYGAAISTCISYIMVFIFRLFHTRKYIYYDLKNNEFIFGSIFLFTSSILIYINNENIFLLIVQVLILFFQVLITLKSLVSKGRE